MSKRKSNEVLFSDINGKTHVLESTGQDTLFIKIRENMFSENYIENKHVIALNMVYASMMLDFNQISKDWYDEYILSLKSKMVIPDNESNTLISLLENMRSK